MSKTRGMLWSLIEDNGAMPDVETTFFNSTLLYRLYERRLLKQVQASPIPHHIGIILDGNRRYGRQENLSMHMQST